MKNTFNKQKWLSFLLIFVITFTTTITPFSYARAVNEEENQTVNAQVTVTDEGIHINGTFYSKEEFQQLLEQAVYTENTAPTTFAITGALSGTWFIPGVGQVVITAAGVVIVAGAVIAAGTWIYNLIEDYLDEKTYQEHKQNGTKTDGHTVYPDPRSLPTTGKPRTSQDRTADGSWNGKVVQRRYFDKNGNADVDIDYDDHGNPKQHPKVPHRHDWVNGVRNKDWY
ncbi:hypothetical protein [Lysinibacillus piscis]|uniref:Uncharacterized protein n=1 Tax=Lysinibacillus piscis TaxID=2518931 RepID=A0ABQ5NJG8_9BACI|nr:hypothetical protein [Lysinibacillus sp. KH24]GLC88511.1 hypothetical protein LYSBPC_16380 [Lysinibacillus sp. KH24]